MTNRLQVFFCPLMRWHKLLWVEEELMQKHSQDLTGSHLKIISLSFDLSFTGLRMQSNSIFQLGITVLKKLFTLWCWEKKFWTVQLKLFICGEEGTCINKWTNQQMLVINHLSCSNMGKYRCQSERQRNVEGEEMWWSSKSKHLLIFYTGVLIHLLGWSVNWGRGCTWVQLNSASKRRMLVE